MKKWVDLSPKQWIGQALFYGMIVALVGYFANGPTLHLVGPDHAELKLVVRYSGKRLGECRKLSSKELEKLAPNMRTPTVCPREKSPLYIDMAMDDQVVYQQTVKPSGLHDDGVLALYKDFIFDAGHADLRVRIRNDMREEQFSNVLEQRVELSPARILVVEFNDDGFKLIQPSKQSFGTG